MKRVVQVRIFKGEKLYVADCLDLAVVTQAVTLDELAANLKEEIALHLEGEDLATLGLNAYPAVIASFELDDVVDAQAKRLSGSHADAIFEQFGFSIVGQRGSHAKLSRVLGDGTRQTLTVPIHGEIDIGTLGRFFARLAALFPQISDAHNFIRNPLEMI